MKQTKIIKTLSRKEVNSYDGEYGSIIKTVDYCDFYICLWLAEKESVIQNCYLVQDSGYYIVLRNDSIELVNECYYETLVEASKAFNEVVDMVKK